MQSRSFVHIVMPVSGVPRLPMALGMLPPPFKLLMRAILLIDFSVIQRLPSGPAVMPLGSAFAVGIGYSETSPIGVMRATALVAPGSMNQRLPSGPLTMPIGRPADGIPNSVIAPIGVMRPIAWASCSTNQRLPSGPAVMARGSLAGVGIANSVTMPIGVMRPILLPMVDTSVNHRFMSGPTVMPV